MFQRKFPMKQRFLLNQLVFQVASFFPKRQYKKTQFQSLIFALLINVYFEKLLLILPYDRLSLEFRLLKKVGEILASDRRIWLFCWNFHSLNLFDFWGRSRLEIPYRRPQGCPWRYKAHFEIGPTYLNSLHHLKM